MTDLYDVAAIGNAIVDVISPCDEAFLEAEGLTKGSMQLIDQGRATELYAKMGRGVETSGGSAANTIAGVASLGGRSAFLGKVAADKLGATFVQDMWAIGAKYRTQPLSAGKTPDEVEAELMAITPEPYLTRAHHWLILHGRYTCVARRPKCEDCVVRDLCPSRDLFI